MKRKILLMIFFLTVIAMSAFSQNSVHQFPSVNSISTTVTDRLDSTYNWDLDLGPSVWHLLRRSIYTNNSDNFATSVLRQSLNSGWMNSGKVTFNRNPNNEIQDEIHQMWDGASWVNVFRITYTYDSDTNVVNFLFETWNTVTNIWENEQQVISTYDPNHNPATDITQVWTSGSWVNTSFDTYSYNGSNLISARQSQNWDGSGWVTGSQNLYHYDGNDLLTDDLYQSWDGTSWTDVTRNLYTYDLNNNVASVISQRTDSSGWLTNSTRSSTYNSYNKILTNTTMTYSGGVLIGADSLYYYYTHVSGIEDMDDQERKLTVYPNPINSFFSIQVNTENSIDEECIYDFTGRLVENYHVNLSDKSPHEIHIAGKISPGLYTLVLKNGFENIAGRIMITK